MWRKTRSNRPRNLCKGVTAGVDPNRNWDYTWDVTDSQSYKRSLHNPCTEVYIGPKAFSEPETKAPSDYMRQRHQRSLQLGCLLRSKLPKPGPGYIAAFLDFHSFLQTLLPVWAYTARWPVEPDGAFQKGLTGAMVAAIKRSSGRNFNAGPDLLPPDPGTGPDWAYGELGVKATMTVELEGPPGDPNGFCAPSTIIVSVGKEQFASVMALARYLIDHGSEPSTKRGTFSKAWNASMQLCSDLPEPSSQKPSEDFEDFAQSSADVSAKAQDKAATDDIGVPDWVATVGWIVVISTTCAFAACLTKQCRQRLLLSPSGEVEFAETTNLKGGTTLGRV